MGVLGDILSFGSGRPLRRDKGEGGDFLSIIDTLRTNFKHILIRFIIFILKILKLYIAILPG